MYNQLKVEFGKMHKSMFFYCAALGFSVAGVMMATSQLFTHGLDISGSDTFLRSISDTSLLFIASLFASYFIGNGFANRTICNEIRIGYSRASVIMSRVLVTLPFASLSYLAYSATYALIMGFSNGFIDSEIATVDVIVRSVLFILQLMSILSFSSLIMFWCKKLSLGMMLSVCFTVVTCNILRNVMSDNTIFRLTPFHRITMNFESMVTQDLLISFASAILTLLAVVLCTFIVFRKAELK